MAYNGIMVFWGFGGRQEERGGRGTGCGGSARVLFKADEDSHNQLLPRMVFLLAQVSLPSEPLRSAVRFCILPLGAWIDLMWAVSSLFWGTFDHLWKILRLFLCDLLTLEIGNLPEVARSVCAHHKSPPPWDWLSFPLWDPVRLSAFSAPTCVLLLSIHLSHGNGRGILHCAFWSGRGSSWMMAETGSNSSIHAVSTISTLPCCSIPGVCIPSELGSHRKRMPQGVE